MKSILGKFKLIEHATTKILQIRNCSRFNLSNFTKKKSMDECDMEMFTEYSKEWWDENSSLKLLHNLNELRVPYIRDLLICNNLPTYRYDNPDKPLEGLNLLEVGCGGGYLTEPLTRLGANTTGLDGTLEVIQVAKLHMQADKSLLKHLKYVHCRIEEFSKHEYVSNYFDAVISSEVIEHVSVKDAFLQSCATCVKPGGLLILSTINRNLLSGLYYIFIGETVLKFIPKGTHNYSKLPTPEELQELIERNNFTVHGVKGFSCHPFKPTWFWTNTTTFSFFLHAVKNK